MNRKRKHPLEVQSDNDWACGLFIMTACILCAFLVMCPLSINQNICRKGTRDWCSTGVLSFEGTLEAACAGLTQDKPNRHS